MFWSLRNILVVTAVTTWSHLEIAQKAQDSIRKIISEKPEQLRMVGNQSEKIEITPEKVIDPKKTEIDPKK